MAEKLAYSRISVKSQTVLPQAVRDRLGIRPGDRLRYRFVADGVLIEKAETVLQDDPFATFAEWSGPDDEAAFADL